MKNKIVIFAALVFAILSGCEDDFLNRAYQTQPTIENITRNGPGPLISNGMAAYAYIREWTQYGGNAMLASACDEADFANPGTVIQRFNTGAWNEFLNPDDALDHYYQGVVQTHRFIKNSENFEILIVNDTLSPASKESYLRNCDDIFKLRAENRFLRAYFYFELVKRYGGVPILQEPLEVNTSTLPARNTPEECFQYIVSELDTAYKYMVDHWLNYNIPNGVNSEIGSGRGDVAGSTDVTRLGRAEKAAAKALKLRVLLYAASPLFNPSNDLSKWELAAAAGNDFITDPGLIWWQQLWTNYENLFYMTDQQLLTSRKGKNSGIIFTRPSTIGGLQSNAFERWNYPAGIPGGATAVTAPSQNLVDAYEMQSTGLPISAPGSGYDPSNPYINRDPRLKLSIGVNNEIFGKSVGGANRLIQAYVGGPDAIGVRQGATTTGYYLKKMVNPNFDLSSASTSKRSFILMRYAEVLLNYAEAMNEAYGPDAKPSINGTPAFFSAREAINLVRARVSMPALPAGLDPAEMRERIRNERRVELAFEEHRFFDVRRWKIAETTENQDLMGMRVRSLNPPLNTEFSYEIFKVENRTFDKNKMYLYPIPEAQVAINGWDQNPGW